MPRRLPVHKRSRFVSDKRLSPSARGYGRRWEKIAKMFKERHPLCADPYGHHRAKWELIPSTEVDHIVALAAGGDHSLENLQALCKRCHSRKTSLENGGFGR